MTEVRWPFEWDNDDEVLEWLENLVSLDKRTHVFTLANDRVTIKFVREEDAIAFKLRFGI